MWSKEGKFVFSHSCFAGNDLECYSIKIGTKLINLIFSILSRDHFIFILQFFAASSILTKQFDALSDFIFQLTQFITLPLTP